MKRRGLAVALVLLPLAAFGVDLTADFDLSSHSGPSYRSVTDFTTSDTVSVGGSVTDWLYFNVDVGVTLTSTLQPTVDLRNLVSVSTSLVNFGLLAEGRFTAGTDHAAYGGYLSASLPVLPDVLGDILSLETSLVYKTDLSGTYGELKLAPTAYLPLGKSVVADLLVLQGYMTSGWDGLTYTGLTTLTLQPEVLINLQDSLAVQLSGGYTLDVSGGQFASFPFGGAKIRFSYGD